MLLLTHECHQKELDYRLQLTAVSILENFLVASLGDLLGVLLAGVIQTPGENASTCSTEASIDLTFELT